MVSYYESVNGSVNLLVPTTMNPPHPSLILHSGWSDSIIFRRARF